MNNSIETQSISPTGSKIMNIDSRIATKKFLKEKTIVTKLFYACIVKNNMRNV